MKARVLAAIAMAAATMVSKSHAQLLISEFLANPNGTDSPFEWVELIATDTIDFSVTPFSVVFANNGTATANGWVEGGEVTYGFNITSGTVTPGSVVYVGGSSMGPTGLKLRVIDTLTTGGDRFGAAAAGVLGNGGGNADGIAIFGTDINNVTASLRPIDAIFFGSGVGSALVSGGAEGYELPDNDAYDGGKLQSTSFLAADPAGGATVAAAGTFDPVTDTWTVPRAWTGTTPSDSVSAIVLAPVPEPSTFVLSALGLASYLVLRWRRQNARR